ncbi:uncharacterized protein LOC121410122 [Lytechinus variegatus]|uniref:uncharacterized protein LOC121410122 n=1 Tax=Lytechinus variegatus TaxID=7654 RepID=UPI001BB1D53C|nr:uncharacterized protein LOC121410122 [Lytechinus variegatus]
MSVRVALWCCQRSMSTLFERCIAAGGHIEIFHEVYLTAYRFGPQHRQENATFETDNDYTYDNVHRMISQKFPPGHAVFLKDMAYSIEGRFPELSFEFCHTFLIRSPQKVIRSYIKLLESCHFDEEYVSELREKLPNSFKQQCLLYDYIMEYGSQSRILVIDADDFVTMPETVLRRYCQETGLIFNECMLSYGSLDSIPDEWHCSKVLKNATKERGSHERALHSTGIELTKPDDIGLELSSDWKNCVGECEKFYNIMFDRRTRFEDH